VVVLVEAGVDETQHIKVALEIHPQLHRFKDIMVATGFKVLHINQVVVVVAQALLAKLLQSKLLQEMVARANQVLFRVAVLPMRVVEAAALGEAVLVLQA